MLHGHGAHASLEGVCIDIVHRAHRLRSEAHACVAVLGHGPGAELAHLEGLLGSPSELAMHAVSADVDELLMTARKVFQARSAFLCGHMAGALTSGDLITASQANCHS